MGSPLLDNIETTGTGSQASKPLIQNGFSDLSTENLYSSALEDLEVYKRLSYETAVALIDFGNDIDWKDRGRKIFDCGSIATLAGKKIVGANFCRIRLCPMCQKRKSLKTFSDFSRLYEALKDYRFLHVVLTVPNVAGDELKETIEDMNKCSSRLFAVKEIKRAFLGIARCLEVSYNSNTITFHPHFHCLVAVKKSYFTSRNYIKHERLRFLWSAIWRRRYDNLKRVSDEQINMSNLLDSCLLQVRIQKADSGALPEIAKYAVKPLEFDGTRKERACVLQSLFEALHGKRMIQTYGIIKDTFKALKIDVNGDFVENDTLDETYRRTYNYNYRLMHYEEVKTN